ncbi:MULTISPECIES: HAMP domain-containing sensor histidine kinase [Bacillaceae]|uniref:histidine kinase n=1 Tax=Domibacillus aminovorans TaxID=29332 RepID=A0A177L275_9BACI|nr:MULTISPECIES: HAMP domain-containing sensor histidine kinase [Bacillaceae]OAH59556.1 histidine kinase [Domibacillus aminovorans]
MNKSFLKMPFRNKILLVLLLNTILLSGFSLIFVHSIEDINQVSKKVKDNNIPGVVWISYWEEELSIKQYIVESYLLHNTSDRFIEMYTSQEMKKFQFAKQNQVEIPKSMESIEREMNLLDFIIVNNVQGLIVYGDEEAAKKYIKDQYLPKMEELKKELEDLEEETFLSLNDHTNDFSTIIEDSLVLLILMTCGAVILSIYASYKISSSLTKPIEKMIHNVNDIANGQYGLTINETNQIELQHLTDSINQMSLRLKESFNKILADKIYLDEILNSLPVGIITSDNQTTFYSLNTSAKNVLDIDEEKVKTLIKNGVYAQNTPFWDILLSKRICQNIKVPLKINGEHYQLLVSQSQLINQHKEVIGRIFYFIDITKTEELENRIHQSEKLALVGELAAGAAHEIRNPLSVIKGFLSLMNDAIPDVDKERFYLPLVMKEIDRINIIVEDMLLLSKPGAPILNETYIEEIINDILPLITQSSLKEDQIKFIIDVERVPVFVDMNQMKQVFYNLIRNSKEAINEQGTIYIYSTKENGFYQIYIKDTGTGIPLDMQQSLYNPFSTSKGNGTGLGLTLVQRIVQNHEGKIELVSTSSEGTTFLVSLPLRS